MIALSGIGLFVALIGPTHLLPLALTAAPLAAVTLGAMT